VIIVSDHEPADYVKFASKIDSIPIDFLVEGDERRYCIERKKVGDLISSVKDGRLVEQLKSLTELRRVGYIPIVVIEGEAWEPFKKYRLTLPEWFSYQVMIAAFGVGVIWVKDISFFKALLSYLDKKAGTKKGEYVRPTVSKHNRTIPEEKEDLLRAMDGVGQVKARKLLLAKKSIKAVANADAEDLHKALFGEAKSEEVAKHIFEVMNDEN
jgi:ERCC4-type nuclease